MLKEPTDQAGSENQTTDNDAEDTKVRPRISVLRGTLASGGASILRLGSNLAIAILVARALGATGKGEITLLQQFAAVFAMILGFGFEGAHAYYVGRRRREASEAVSDSLFFAVIVSAIGIPVLWVVMRYFVRALDDVAGSVLLLASLMIFPMILVSLLAGVLIGQGRVRSQALAMALSASVGLGIVVLRSLFVELTLGTVVIAISAGLLTGVAASIAATGVRRIPRPSIRRLTEEASYAWRSYVQNVAGYLELRQDTLLLGVLASAASVGVYSVGVSVAEVLFLAPQTVVFALTARSLQENAASGAELSARLTRLLMAFTLGVSLLLLVLARPLIEVAFGEEFVSAALVYAILVPGILSWTLSSQLQAYLATHGRLFPGLGLSAVFMNLVLNLLLIPRFGIYGAAVATSISYCFGNGYVTWVFLKRTEFRLRDVWLPRREDLMLVVAAARALRRSA